MATGFRFSIKQSVLIVAIVVATFVAFVPFSGQSAQFSHSAAVVLITLVFWSTGLVPPFLAGLIFFALTAIFRLIEPTLLFSGFGSTAVWLITSGFVIGSAISSTGLGKRMASVIAPHLTGSYTKLIGGLVISAALLGFVMPSSVGRAVVLLPIGMALGEQVGFKRGANGRIGIAVALALSCNLPSFAVLPANIPNMILAGASETLYDVQFSYTDYLLLHFPVLGVLKSFFIVVLVLKMFPDEIAVGSHASAEDTETNVDPKLQKRLAILLGITLLFWVTDSIHGVNPAWIGLVAAIILLLPGIGVVAPKSFNGSVDFGTVVFVSAALGLGMLVNESGIGSYMGEVFSQLLPSSSSGSFLSFMALSLTSVITGLVTTIPGVPAVLSPLASEFAQATGLPTASVLMTQVLGFSTAIFPYQVAPLVVAMQLSQEKLINLVKVTLPLTAITVFFLFPLDYVWWLLLGWI
ncbi:sodium:sulfate symporter [Vibrio sp. HA2012]|uniref:SLC13 family permease n=1 Tax=Vibrio sp. HA2012 TaxID=1971595 RepID=UPI000C2B7DFE|nr:SLC13 family permease [Vibrio sp. HA2012]PJC86679.1 sodium:sulfate symporter [Vibrio sp. HA2012]